MVVTQKLNVAVLSLLLFTVVSKGQTKGGPITQREACSQFMPAVVRVDVANGEASGFIVSPDGWIVTAAHVLFDPQTFARVATVSVTLSDHTVHWVTEFHVDPQASARDFALLKIDKVGLPFLELGSESEVSPGDDLTIIGYPFAAGTGASFHNKLCLSGMVAGAEIVPQNGININAVYFQGPAIKGLSGGPIISRTSGHVIGILVGNLAGISEQLRAIENTLVVAKAQGTGMTAVVNFNDTFLGIIGVLDRHLTNGLGLATGADDAARFLTVTKRQYEKGKKKN